MTAIPEQQARIAQLEQVLESIKDAVLRVDGDLRVSLMNSAAISMFRVRDWLGRDLGEVARVPSFVEFMRNEDRQDDSSVEFDIVRSPHTRHILARVTKQDDGGQVAVLRDVTTMKRLERMRQDFVANVSHELRTPISVVSANSETLLDGALDDKRFAPTLVEAVHRNANRLTLIVNDLLDLSRIEAGSYSFHLGKVFVRNVAMRVEESLRDKAEAKNTQVHVDIDDSIAVRTDDGALFQVLVNYLENAIKYTPDGSEIVIAARPRKNMIRIEVRDNGAGIPADVRDRVFERFFRVDPGRSREMGGTGLGLSIVKHLVEAMGGRVGVAPVEPTGSNFWLDLPLA